MPKKHKNLDEIIKSIEKNDGLVDTDLFIRLFAQIGDFTLRDSRIAKETLSYILELIAYNQWDMSVGSIGTMKYSVFPPKDKVIPKRLNGKIVKDEDGNVVTEVVPAQPGVRLYFALSENIVDSGRQGIRERYENGEITFDED